MKSDQGGFNSVYMMLDSGARVLKTDSSVIWYERFDTAKPQKAGAVGAEIIEAIVRTVYQFWNTLSLPTVLIKVLRIPLLKLTDAGYLTKINGA